MYNTSSSCHGNLELKAQIMLVGYEFNTKIHYRLSVASLLKIYGQFVILNRSENGYHYFGL